MRIAIAGISHETNTYCQGVTGRESFYTYQGDEMLGTSGQESDLGGAVDACAALGVEAVPILFASAQPSAVIRRDVYEEFKAIILAGLADAGDLDGCVLLLHGAGVVEGIDDLEGDLATAVRTLLGELPIAASFDLHANLTQQMADQLNAVFVCHEYPHIDMHLRATEAVAAVQAMATSGARGACSVLTLPMLLPTTTTFEGIGQQLLSRLLQLEKQAPCIDLSWCHGFPYTDVPHVGCSVVSSYYPDDAVQAQAAATAFAEALWQAREDFRPVSLDGDEAVAVAQKEADGPVVIHETSDNCGGGAPGDGTHLLRAMLAAGLGADACFSFVVDAEVATQAHEAGVGAQISVSLGGKTDDLHGAPLQLTAYVKALHDGRLVMQHMFRGAPINLGRMARLVVDDMDIVVASRRSQTFDREPFLALGIDVMKYRYVALKSSNHFRAGFQHIASAIVTADTPGLNTHRLERFPRQTTTKRLWPLDELAQYP
ncbi:MAG: M81 family metallopeptidase [Pseudomonadota bacterium]